MFNFTRMMMDYEQRKVARYPDNDSDWIVDTAAVNDSAQPYETAVKHPNYNKGEMVIVELYDTKEEAQAGHDKWVKTMTAKKLPKTLRDVSTAEIAQLCDVFGGEEWRVKGVESSRDRSPSLSSEQPKIGETLPIKEKMEQF